MIEISKKELASMRKRKALVEEGIALTEKEIKGRELQLAKAMADDDCPDCDGLGVICGVEYAPEKANGVRETETICETCGGTGRRNPKGGE